MPESTEETDVKVVPFLPNTLGGTGDDPEGGYQYKGGAGGFHYDPHLLTKFPSDLDVGKGKVKSKSLTSIPDIWARAHFFSQALLNARHPGHDDVLNEWYGLLGLICFAETYQINLAIQPINLPLLATNKPDAPPIARPLLDMVPNDMFKEFRLIVADTVLVGVTSPFSFVFTPPSYQAEEGVPWRAEDGRLTNPVTSLAGRGGMYDDMLGYLKSWIDGVKSLITYLSLNKGEQNTLAKLLEVWGDTITAPIKSITSYGKCAIPTVRQTAPLQSLPQLGIGEEVLSAVQIDPTCLSANFIKKIDPKCPPADFIKKKREFSPIVFWSEGWSQNVRVWRGFDSKNVPAPDGKQGLKLFGEKIPRRWIDPKKLFFTEQIVKVQLEGESVRCAGGEQYLLPLRPEIFDYFDANRLESMFELKINTDETVSAILRIPLTGGGKAAITYEYSPNRQITSFDRDAIVLWPNVALENWSHYYLFARFPEKGVGDWSCEPLGSRRIDESEFGGDLQKSRIWRLDSPPEAVVFSKDGRPVGCILPKLSKRPAPTGSGTWGIAVDFGTTNTAIARRDIGEKMPQPLHFESRLLTLMRLPEGPAMFDVLGMQFLTPEERHLRSPFPSVYFPLVHAENPKPITDGNIPFEQPFLRMETGFKDYAQYSTRLKWEKDEVAVKKVNGFLSQALIMSFLEARCAGADRVELHWTYPSAFEKNRRIHFDKTWRSLASTLKIETGIGLKLREGREDDGDPTITESIAVCQYGRQFHGFKPGGPSAHVTIDIGGGTTDIAIWQDGYVRSQSSLLIAADVIADFIQCDLEKRASEHRKTDAFLHSLLLWSDLAGGRFPTIWEGAIRSKNSGAAINALYRYHSDEIVKGMMQNAGATPPVQRAISVAACLLGAASFYAGLMLKASLPATTELNDDITVLFAGNGSRLLLWLGDEPVYRPRIGRFFISGFGTHDRKLTFKLLRSEAPKMETAMGILNPQAVETHIPNASVLLGEDGISLGGKTRDRCFDLASIRPENKEEWSGFSVGKDMPVLKEFIKVYNEVAGELDLDRIPATLGLAGLQNDIHDAMHSFRLEPDKASLVSPFVLGVKHLIEQMIKSSD